LRLPGLDPVDARVLLQHVLGMSHAGLIAHSGRRLDEAQQRHFHDLARRRAEGEPVAYLLGWREFYGRPFQVDSRVLIPRPETELLVDLALARLEPGVPSQLLDLGAGSGNVALALALERPACQVTAIDASPHSLAVAHDNKRLLGAGNISLIQGEWLEPVVGRAFDLVVSNPPYVAEADPCLDRGDLRYEPRLALASGPDGLDAIRRIVATAPRHLKPGGWLLFEHGFDQDNECRRLLAEAGFADIMTVADLAELPRVSGGRRAQ
jgi:release factor glutamine methyltransferase